MPKSSSACILKVYYGVNPQFLTLTRPLPASPPGALKLTNGFLAAGVAAVANTAQRLHTNSVVSLERLVFVSILNRSLSQHCNNATMPHIVILRGCCFNNELHPLLR